MVSPLSFTTQLGKVATPCEVEKVRLHSRPDSENHRARSNSAPRHCANSDQNFHHHRPAQSPSRGFPLRTSSEKNSAGIGVRTPPCRPPSCANSVVRPTLNRLSLDPPGKNPRRLRPGNSSPPGTRGEPNRQFRRRPPRVSARTGAVSPPTSLPSTRSAISKLPLFHQPV